VAHPLGKSSHARAATLRQRRPEVTWEYLDSQGAEYFTGSQKVVADKDGLRVFDIKATSKITLLDAARSENFAAWMHLGDIWRTSGTSRSRIDPVKYQKLEKGSAMQGRARRRGQAAQGARG